MRIKCLCCDVFARLAYATAAASPYTVDLELVPMLAHMEPARLRGELQARINQAADPARYDYLVMGYGLCGNATAGLTAPVTMILPRVHDCSALFLGSRQRFTQVFGDNLSMRWGSCGYYERCYAYDWIDDSYEAYRTNPEYIKLVEDYGEDNADYVWQTMHPPLETTEAVYLKLDGYEYGDAQRLFTEKIEQTGHTVRTEAGNPDWFFRLINGPWDTADFLTVPAGQVIEPIYDLQEVMRAAPQA